MTMLPASTSPFPTGVGKVILSGCFIYRVDVLLIA